MLDRLFIKDIKREIKLKPTTSVIAAAIVSDI